MLYVVHIVKPSETNMLFWAAVYGKSLLDLTISAAAFTSKLLVAVF